MNIFTPTSQMIYGNEFLHLKLPKGARWADTPKL